MLFFDTIRGGETSSVSRVVTDRGLFGFADSFSDTENRDDLTASISISSHYLQTHSHSRSLLDVSLPYSIQRTEGQMLRQVSAALAE